MLMSTGGTVIKVPVEDVKRLGRSTQGVIVMRTRDGEEVSTLAPVVDQPDVPEVGQGEDEAAEAPAEAADEAPVEAEAVAEPGADE
jgi:DNA gyrase subunit A